MSRMRIAFGLALATVALAVVPLVVAATPDSTAEVQFGLEGVGSPFQAPEDPGHDESQHAVDTMVPRTVVISRGGTVTFHTDFPHVVGVYPPGVKPKDVDTDTLTSNPFAPFLGERYIDDPKLEKVSAFPSPGPSFSPTFTFEEPGRYLVICTFLPHFEEADMYGWVIVQ